jgi:hypothetical protein
MSYGQLVAFLQEYLDPHEAIGANRYVRQHARLRFFPRCAFGLKLSTDIGDLESIIITQLWSKRMDDSTIGFAVSDVVSNPAPPAAADTIAARRQHVASTVEWDH